MAIKPIGPRIHLNGRADNMVYVRRISAEDFEFAVQLTDTMDWNLVEEDFEFMMDLEPEGCFMAIEDSEKIGVTTTISYGQVGWVGNVIVSEEHRRRGIGALLVKHSLDYLASKGVGSVGLYAYPHLVSFYERAGFEKDSTLVVLKRKASSKSAKNLGKIRTRHLQKIIDLDALCFGASREKLLKPILSNTANLCYSKVEGKRVLGFIVAKTYSGMAEVGPMVCRQGREDAAFDLLKTTLTNLKGFEVSIYVSEKATSVLDTLLNLGFMEQFRLVKMVYGMPFGEDCIYAAESLERG